jgi:dTDP-D-glucose 4,6-dehydratase
VADNRLARELLGWEPAMSFVDGLHRMTDWYFENHDVAEVRRTLDGGGLIERTVEPVRA